MTQGMPPAVSAAGVHSNRFEATTPLSTESER